MTDSLRIVFMGTPLFALPSLERLCQEGYVPVAVYTQPDKINGRRNSVRFSPVKTFAMDHHIPVLQPTTLKTENAQRVLGDWRPDLFVVIAYGQILPQAVLDIPTYGAVNVHASLLPAYRGAAPIQRVLLDGEKETGVTIMQLDAGMDTGPIIRQVKTEISPHMTAEELSDRLSRLGADALLSVVNDLPAELAASHSQNASEATYADKITKDMGRIDWAKPASKIDALIRGLYPNPGTYSFFRGKRIKILRAYYEEGTGEHIPGQVVNVQNGTIKVSTGQGILVLTILQPENHKSMSGADFINGYRVTNDDRFET